MNYPSYPLFPTLQLTSAPAEHEHADKRLAALYIELYIISTDN